VTTSTEPPISACSDFAPPPKVVDLDLETLLLEEAAALRDRQRQVVQERLSADAERDLGLFRRAGSLGEALVGQRRRERQRTRADEKRAAFHEHPPKVLRPLLSPPRSCASLAGKKELPYLGS
jgi:hypothetical protein